MATPGSAREAARLAELRAYGILDTPAEASFDDIVDLAAYIAGTPTSLISLVDDRRQWIKARHGSSLIETTREVAFCTHVVVSEAPVIVPDTRTDPRFVDNPLVTGEPYIRYYAGFPLVTPSQHVLGTLCVIDGKPNSLDPAQVAQLEKLSRRVLTELELRRELRNIADEHDRLTRSETRLARANSLLEVVTTAQTAVLHGEPVAEIHATLLERFLTLTQSEFGFIGEVLHDERGRPYLRTHAITNIAWDEPTRRLYADNRASGFEFRKLDTLFGAVLTTAQPLISNGPANDPRRGGLPPGHPPLRAFMGLPFFKAGRMVGMVGVANRPGGYSVELADFLAPFLATCGSIVEACRAEAALQASNAALEAVHADLRRSHTELTQVLDLLAVATLAIDAEGTITYVSEGSLALLGVGAEAIGRPWTDVIPFDPNLRASIMASFALPERERGRFGARLQLGDEVHRIEVDVRDDPRAPEHRILFVYDVSSAPLHRDSSVPRHAGLVGDSEGMRGVYDLIDQVAVGNWTVLVEGETGTGKELIARAVHAASQRHDGPFVAVNCAGLTDTLLASQLFGHIKGAFTGATRDQPGLFEAAAGGTLFLDEIGDVSLTMQRTLLRVLQERELTRVGETSPRKVDVRIVAATHRDLQAMSRRGEFREDLLYRIRVARIRVPPLRSRREDIPELVAHFLADDQVTHGKDVRGVDPHALALLQDHSWPGNVRELRGTIEHAVVRATDTLLRTRNLPSELVPRLSTAEPTSEEEDPSRGSEAEAILAALRQAGGNRSKAAKLLGISRATLYRRFLALGLDPV